MKKRYAKPWFEPLSGLDSWFLYAERPEAPLHIGSVMIFEGGSRVAGGRGALGIARTIEERLHRVPRYRQKLRHLPLNIGHPVWVDDPDFDLSFHVRRAALPSPGTVDELRDYAARVFARPLDLRKPLWELTVVEGLTEGRVAIVYKVHHSMVDGISTIDLATLLFDADPEGMPPENPKPWAARPAPSDSTLVRDALRRMVPLEAVRELTESRVQDLADRITNSPWTGALELGRTWLTSSNRLFFNRPIGPHRRIGGVRISLQKLKDVKNALGGTINDVVLTVVGEAMHRWIKERDEAIPDRVRVFVPVSVRDDSRRQQLGNLVSGMVVEIPTARMPPGKRLQRVQQSTGDLKRSRQAVAASTLTTMANWGPATVQALAGRVMTSQSQWQNQRVVNFVVTNVPGPQFPFYSGGAMLLEVWPFVSIYHSLGLNIAVVSYNGDFHFGFLADRDLVPDLDRLSDHIASAVADLHDAAANSQAKKARARRRTQKLQQEA